MYPINWIRGRAMALALLTVAVVTAPVVAVAETAAQGGGRDAEVTPGQKVFALIPDPAQPGIEGAVAGQYVRREGDRAVIEKTFQEFPHDHSDPRVDRWRAERVVVVPVEWLYPYDEGSLYLGKRDEMIHYAKRVMNLYVNGKFPDLISQSLRDFHDYDSLGDFQEKLRAYGLDGLAFQVGLRTIRNDLVYEAYYGGKDVEFGGILSPREADVTAVERITSARALERIERALRARDLLGPARAHVRMFLDEAYQLYPSTRWEEADSGQGIDEPGYYVSYHGIGGDKRYHPVENYRMAESVNFLLTSFRAIFSYSLDSREPVEARRQHLHKALRRVAGLIYGEDGTAEVREAFAERLTPYYLAQDSDIPWPDSEGAE